MLNLLRFRITPMGNRIIRIPEFEASLVRQTQCPYCGIELCPEQVVAAGLMRAEDQKAYFYCDLKCGHCSYPLTIRVVGRVMTTQQLATELQRTAAIVDDNELGEDAAERERVAKRHLLTNRAKMISHLLTNGDNWFDQRSKQVVLLTTLKPTGVKLNVRYPTRTVPHDHLDVLGGYRDGNQVMLLYRFTRLKFTPFDSFAMLLAGQKVSLGGSKRRGDHILPSDWSRFDALRAGTRFRCGSRWWRKLSRPALHDLLDGKRFLSAV
jgi:hypothetical protein